MKKQSELDGMPPKTKGTLRAEEVIDALEILADKQTVFEKRKASLVTQMKEEKVKTIKCKSSDGRIFTFNIEELEKLKVVKPKAEE